MDSIPRDNLWESDESAIQWKMVPDPISKLSTSLEAIELLPGGLCSVCNSMTATSDGLIALITTEGYAHHAFPHLQASAKSGCGFCASIFSHLSRAKLATLDSDEKKVEVPFDENVRTRIFGHCDEMIRERKRTSILKCITVEIFYESRKCILHVPAPNSPWLMESTLAFKVFTDISEQLRKCPLLIGGKWELLSFDQKKPQISVTGKKIAEESRKLLQECATKHSSTCPPGLVTRLPTRVLDINSDRNSQGLRLHISAADEQGQYAALSYCWGPPPHNCFTTRSTLDDPSKFDWEKLPATIKDAVKVTRDLGIRYLWVDSLCIAQDDEADKSEEIKNMGRIYKNAAVTIAAASTPSVHKGFLEDRSIPITEFPIEIWGNKKLNFKFWIHQNMLKGPKEPLDYRGWTFQESLLSPRILYYGSKDLVWKCQLKTFQPVLPSHDLYSTSPLWGDIYRLPSAIFDLPSGTPLLITDFWLRIQTTYSQRKLELAEDRYLALGGIVEEIQRVTGDTYIAGVWKNKIAKMLAWFDNDTAIEDAAPKIAKPPTGRPSWSWLARLRPIIVLSLQDFDDTDTRRMELLSWSVKLADESAPFGHVEAAELELSGLVIQTTKIPVDILAKKSRVFKLMLDFKVQNSGEKAPINCVREDYYYFLLGRNGVGTMALLLQSLEDGSFIRLGIASMSDMTSTIWSMADAHRMKLKLVCAAWHKFAYLDFQVASRVLILKHCLRDYTPHECDNVQ